MTWDSAMSAVSIGMDEFAFRTRHELVKIDPRIQGWRGQYQQPHMTAWNLEAKSKKHWNQADDERLQDYVEESRE